MRKLIHLVSTHHSGTKGRWGKMSSHWLLCTQQDHTKIYLAYAKGRRIFCPTEWCKLLFHLGTKSRISLHSIGWLFNTQDSLHFTIWKIWIHQSTLCTHTSTCIFPGTHDRCSKNFPFVIAYLDDIIFFSRMAEQHLDHIQAGFQNITECSVIDETQQMPLLCQRDPVPWTHSQHYRHQTTTIKNSSHQQHASTSNS